MSDKKIIAVTTATGLQGFSIVQELLKEGTYAVRGLTRDPSSTKAQELKQMGVEVVKADMDDVPSLDAAFKGAYGVYGNTVWTLFPLHNFSQAETRDHETQHGKNLVDAAKRAGVQHFVWSTLEGEGDLDPLVYHMVSKQRVNKYLIESGIPIWTLLYLSCYFSNLTTPGIEFLKKEEGGLYLDMPAPFDTPIDWYDPRETGLWVVPIFVNASHSAGQRVDATGEKLTVQEMAAKLEAYTGTPVRYNKVSAKEFMTDEFRKTVMDELWLNFSAWVTNGFKRDYNLSKLVALRPAKTFGDFLAKDKSLRDFLGLA